VFIPVEHKQNTHHSTQKILCYWNSLFTTPISYVKSVSFVWKTVYNMQWFK
jgi:hypothetical protein